jgi:hypothetical protein
MLATPRVPASAACLAALVAATVAPAPVAAAEWQTRCLEPAIQAWMGVVTMLAEDGAREERPHERRDHQRGREMHGHRHDHNGRAHHGPHDGRMHPPGHPHSAHMGPPRPEGPRADALSMLQDISGRLARIERMLAARAPGGPGRGEWRGPERPDMSSEAREMMGSSRARMQAAREQWEQASPEEREKMKQQWQERMTEGREKMKAAREKWEQASPEEREKMKQQWQELRGKAGRRMEETTPRSEGSRPRRQDMEARVKQLEAEVARLKQALEKED